VVLTPFNLGTRTKVEVDAGPFGTARVDSPLKITLSGSDAFFQVQNGTYFLSGQRNHVYDTPYERTDGRLDKEWAFDRCKLTFYAEVVNMFDRANQRFDDLNGYNPTSGQARLEFMNMLPVLPEAGLTFEF
jgi:hypothetical protein